MALVVGGLGCLGAGALVALIPALLLLATAVTGLVVLHSRRARADGAGTVS